MKLEGIHHVSINVHDAAVATRFYVDVLGLTERTDRPDFGFGGAWLQVGDEQVHLLEVPEFEPPVGQHFAISVADLDASIAELATHGVRCSEPALLDGICRQTFFKDPTGNLIELNQPV
jgi:catechol 2,3-dioxygenase-like lactoylglutathione lyase family enzyme